MDYDLSILIPARSEMFLSRTVEDLLKNIRGKTEILIGLDGEWANPPIVDDPRVTILYYGESIGQRAMTNQLCKLSKAKYVMKCDAHCAFDEGFDAKMMENMQDDWTMIPLMLNLHVFDWVCKEGHRRYQGPSGPCAECGKETKMDIVWIAKDSPKSTAYMFDTTLHFQYFSDLKKRLKDAGDITDTMSAQGSCFMMTREKYWELDICDEEHGSWGQQGTEIACKTWLSGGRLVCNQKTWYAHMFRTQGKGFSFPYPQSGRQVEHARKYSRDTWFNNSYSKQIHPLSWLIEKFKPVPKWHDKEGKEVLDMVNRKGREFSIGPYAASAREGRQMTGSVLFYTDNEVPVGIGHMVKKQIEKAIKGTSVFSIVSVSLKPMDFGKNIHLNLKRGYLTMAKQILAGLEASGGDYIVFCEHDVLYHPSHFKFQPPNDYVYYYNTHVWRVRASDGHALYCDGLQQLSGLCANRETLIKHFKERVRRLESYLEGTTTWNGTDYEHTVRPSVEEFNKYVRAMGFEPGTHGRPERIDDLKAESWQSDLPNIDIRHDNTLTPSRWNKDQFRNERYTRGWKESTLSKIPGWNFKDYDLLK